MEYSRVDKYILVEKAAVHTNDASLEEIAHYEEKDFSLRRRVAQTRFYVFGKAVFVSTVFLEVDHAPPGADPLLFETMVFVEGGPDSTRRYNNWYDAELGHKKIVYDFLMKAARPITKVRMLEND